MHKRPSPPAYERPLYRHERPVPAPRPRPQAQPDEYRGSDDEIMGAPQTTALHPTEQHVQMEAADLWAIANLKFPELPPPEYDHMPDRPITIKDFPTEAQLRVACGWPASPYGGTLVGCFDASLDRINLGPIPSWTGLTRNLVIRHELGHANKWPADHPGMR